MNINYSILHKAADSGYVLDLLGRPVKFGDTVLVKGYGSVTFNKITSVVSVNKKTISVDVPCYHYNRSTGKHGESTKRMTRSSADFLILPADYLAESTKLHAAFVNEHPEIFI